MGVNGFSLSSKEFVDFIESLGLQDLSLMESEFTFLRMGREVCIVGWTDSW